MLNFLYKATMLIITINAIMFFVAGSDARTTVLSGQFNWVPTALRTDTNVTSTSQVAPSGIGTSDTNANLQQTAITNTTNILHFGDFLAAMASVIGVILFFLFGFLVWMPMILPYPFWVLFAVPLVFVQLVGLFTLFQGIVGIMIFAIKSFI